MLLPFSLEKGIAIIVLILTLVRITLLPKVAKGKGLVLAFGKYNNTLYSLATMEIVYCYAKRAIKELLSNKIKKRKS